MKFQIVELDDISGVKASIYSVIILNSDYTDTLYDRFLEENSVEYPEAIEDIEDALETMGNKTGLRGNRIIPFEAERFDDGIVAICNRPDKILRLYGIMYGEYVAIIGGGGVKNFAGQLKQDEKLKSENDLIVRIKKILNAAEESGDITIIEQGIQSTTNFVYNSADYE